MCTHIDNSHTFITTIILVKVDAIIEFQLKRVKTFAQIINCKIYWQECSHYLARRMKPTADASPP